MYAIRSYYDEAQKVDLIFGLAVQADHLGRLKAAVGRHRRQIRPPLAAITHRYLQQAAGHRLGLQPGPLLLQRRGQGSYNFV